MMERYLSGPPMFTLGLEVSVSSDGAVSIGPSNVYPGFGGNESVNNKL